jgi:hypothetical protein
MRDAMLNNIGTKPTPTLQGSDDNVEEDGNGSRDEALCAGLDGFTPLILKFRAFPGFAKLHRLHQSWPRW